MTFLICPHVCSPIYMIAIRGSVGPGSRKYSLRWLQKEDNHGPTERVETMMNGRVHATNERMAEMDERRRKINEVIGQMRQVHTETRRRRRVMKQLAEQTRQRTRQTSQ